MGFENGHLARVVLSAQNGRDQVVNVLHYNLEGDVVDPPASLQTLADRVKDDVIAAYRTLFPTGWTINPVVATDELDPQNPHAVRDSAQAGTSLTGTGGTISAGDQAPYEECVVASLLTGHVGRRYRGRLFLPPIFDESKTDGGQLSTLYVSQYQSFIDDIPKEPDLATGVHPGSRATWCVYSRRNREQNIDPYASPIIDAIVRPRLRWLRSRAK